MEDHVFQFRNEVLDVLGVSKPVIASSEESNGDVDLGHIIFRRRVLRNKGVCSGKLDRRALQDCQSSTTSPGYLCVLCSEQMSTSE